MTTSTPGTTQAAHPADAGIAFVGVSKRYGDDPKVPPAVNQISFSVPRGSLTTILGPSGCGKTTTLRMIAGLETPTSGQVWIDGEDVTRRGPSERNVSLVFQSYALFPHLSVLDNVCYGLRMKGVASGARRERALAALKGVGLTGFDARLPSELSGGQQQRVALARALVLEPSVLLFDEPLSNLDARLRREMRDEIRALQQRLGLTVAYVTHDQTEALAVSDQIIVMNQGVIAQMGSPQALYERPSSAFVAGFMGEARLFDVEIGSDGRVGLGTLRWRPLAAYPPGKAVLAVRPEAWRLGSDPTDALRARLMRSVYLGSSREYTFETDLGEIFVVSNDVAQPLDVGSDTALSLAGHGVSVIPRAD